MNFLRLSCCWLLAYGIVGFGAEVVAGFGANFGTGFGADVVGINQKIT